MQGVDKALEKWLARTLTHLYGFSYGHCDCLRHQIRLRERCKLHQPYPIRVSPDEVTGHLQGEPRLARAAGSGKGQ